jgi:leader peptidase (prepilin peptidase)/N-methyltransferase
VFAVFMPILASLVLAGLLLAASLIDLRTLRIPDPLNAAIVVSGLAATWALDRPLLAAIIGVGAGYAALYVMNYAYRAVRGRDGLGLGDAKLLAGAGAWLGWSGLPFVVLIASALGLAYVSFRRLRGAPLAAQDALAFGPFLAIATFAVWAVQIWS